MNRSLLLWCEIAIARDAILPINRNVPISPSSKWRPGAAQNAIIPRFSPPEDSGASAKLDIPAEAAQSPSGINSRSEEGRLLEDKSDARTEEPALSPPKGLPGTARDTGVERRAR